MVISQFLNKSRLPQLLMIFIGLLLLIYTFTRASILSITHDEAIIYLKSLNVSLYDIFNYKILAQDHMLNSFMIKISMILFPDTAFFIRLPNLLGHIIYITASYLIARRFTENYMSVVAFILLTMNPYLLDFFSIARGYGLSTSFMLISIFYILTFAQTTKTKNLFLSYFFAVLSVLSVFSLLIYFAALLGWTVIYLFNRKIKLEYNNRKDVRNIAIQIAIILTSIVFLYLKLHETLAKTANAEFIHYKQWGNYYTNTLRSVLYNSMYSNNPRAGVTILSYAYGVFFAVAIIKVSYDFVKKKAEIIRTPISVIIFIFMFISAGIIYLHEFKDIVYPTNKTSTFVYSVLVLIIILTLGTKLKSTLIKNSLIILSLLLTTSALYFTLSYSNFRYYKDWRYDSATSHAVIKVQEYHNLDPKESVNFGINWIFEPSINFYRVTRGLSWLNKVDRKGFESDDFDYYYVFASDTTGGKFKNMKLLEVFPESQTLLYVNEE